MRATLRAAAKKNVFIIFALWNGALMRQQHVKDLFTDDAKLDSFLEKVLTPMVAALANEPALAAWEIMNEPEGSVAAGVKDDEPCFDTTTLSGSGAGWAGGAIPMERLQRFTNKHAASIRRADPKALVTTGAWSEYSSTDATLENGRKFFNYWKDACLAKAGGEATGTLSIYQIHTYAHSGSYSPGSPLVVSSSAFGLDKPIVIGEFSAASCVGSGCDVVSLYAHALSQGFAGAWDWALNADDGNDNAAVAEAGMRSLRGDTRKSSSEDRYPHYAKDTRIHAAHNAPFSHQLLI